MKVNKRNKIVGIILILILLIAVTLKLAVWDNPILLCEIAEGFDEPSTPFYIVLDRIYKNCEKKNYAPTFIRYLDTGENEYLHDKYIRILGVLGEADALYELKKLYIKYQDNKNYQTTIYYIICSIGMIGKDNLNHILETMLSKHDDLDVQVSGATVASSLYLITGDSNYYFKNSSGEMQKLYLSKEMIDARKVIVSSKGRKRTFEEMIILDKLYRRPDRK